MIVVLLEKSSDLKKLAFPTAVTTISADVILSFKFLVLLCAIVNVTFYIKNNCAKKIIMI